MKKVLNFVKGKKDDKKEHRINPQISVEITNPSGQKITSDDEHIIGLQQGFGYNIDMTGKDKSLLKIHKAAWFGNLEKLKLHSKKFDINTADHLNRTCLHLAVAQGHTEVAWYLLNNNASTTACDSDGLTPFLKAVECGHKDCTNLLIECGVDVNCTDKQGNTALHIAARSGFYNIASLLLKEGANINVPNNLGEYALHMATNCDHKEMVELLLRYGANVDVLDRERRTPLMLAARNGFSTIIKVLLDNGAALDSADSNGWTAEDYAQFGGHQDLMDLLKVIKIEEAVLDSSDKLSVQSSDPSEHVNFESLNEKCEIGEDLQDSPKSCVIPPALEPPRSWDLIQSGVIDQEGTDRRKSQLTLGIKREGNESGSSEFLVPAILSPSGDGIPLEMRLSPEPLNRDLAPTPERRTRSPLERAHSLDISSDQESPTMDHLRLDDLEDDSSRNKSTLLDNSNNLNETQLENTLPNGDNNNIIILDNIKSSKQSLIMNNNEYNDTSVDNINLQGNYNSNKNGTRSGSPLRTEENGGNKSVINGRSSTIESSQSFDNLGEKSFDTGVSSSLDNLDEVDGKSLSIEIIQSTGNLDETLSICTVPTKHVFRESHSLELLENGTEEGKSYKHKRHHRNKSITITGQPQFWKSVDVIHRHPGYDKGSIDAQLICYDEALRQLANIPRATEVPKPAEVEPINNTSLEKAEDMLSQTEDEELNELDCPSFSNIRPIDPYFDNGDPQSTHFDNDIPSFTSLPSSIEPFFESENDDHHDMKYNINPQYESDLQCHSFSSIAPYPIENYGDLDSLERETIFPPPPIHFLEKGDFESMGVHCDLPEINPISMLTPIKENQQETDSISLAENADSNVSENSANQMFSSRFDATPNHFNVEVIVNTEPVKETDKISVPHLLPDDENGDDLSEADDVFLEDGNMPDHFGNYFVDVKALQLQPSSVDFSKVVIPDDSPSPKSKPKQKDKKGSENSETRSDNPSTSGSIQLDKSDSESEPVVRPLRRKRKLLLAMRGAGIGSSKDTDNDLDDVDDIDEDEDDDSDEEDPPFWQNTEKGGYFTRQNTVVALPPTVTGSINKVSKGEFPLAGPSQSKLGVKLSCGTPTGSSEAETASASDTPRHDLSPLGLKSTPHPHQCEAVVEKTKLEETAATLLGKAERLKYELEDCRQAEASRDDTITILQTQLSRLESRYGKAQEELCRLRQRATTAEHELNHLRELCSNLSKDKAEMYNELSKHLDSSVAGKEEEETEGNKEACSNEDSPKKHLRTMINHLEEAKKIEEEKTKHLIHHLEEVYLKNQNMISEREALIAQNIADVRKLQEDTICWKERYEELAAKLEMVDKKQDPRLIEAQDTIATLKRTIAILQQEKSLQIPNHYVSCSSFFPN